jgi:hypothetical protein
MAFMPIDRSEWQRDERGQGRHAEEVQSRHVMAHGERTWPMRSSFCSRRTMTSSAALSTPGSSTSALQRAADSRGPFKSACAHRIRCGGVHRSSAEWPFAPFSEGLAPHVGQEWTGTSPCICAGPCNSLFQHHRSRASRFPDTPRPRWPHRSSSARGCCRTAMYDSSTYLLRPG